MCAQMSDLSAAGWALEVDQLEGTWFRGVDCCSFELLEGWVMLQTSHWRAGKLDDPNLRAQSGQLGWRQLTGLFEPE